MAIITLQCLHAVDDIPDENRDGEIKSDAERKPGVSPSWLVSIHVTHNEDEEEDEDEVDEDDLPVFRRRWRNGLRATAFCIVRILYKDLCGREQQFGHFTEGHLKRLLDRERINKARMNEWKQ